MALVEHIYGRTITFRYIPIAGDEEFKADSLVSARIYGPNSYPTAEQIEDAGSATTGHVERVTSWSLVNREGTGPAEYEITFAALTDPNPTSGSDHDLYYVALNYRATAAAQVLRDVEQLIVYRPDGLTSKIRVTAQDVFDLESRVEDYMEQLLVEAKIDAAIEEVLSRLEGRGYKKRHLFNMEKLNGTVRRLACAYCCQDLAGEGNQYWAEKARFWREASDKLFEIAQVGYDSAGNDTPGMGQKVATGAVWITR